MIAQAAPREHYGWLIERAGAPLTGAARAIEAVDAKGVIRGMVAYDFWTDNAVFAHVAVETPIAWRSLLPAIFDYPFNEAGKGVLVAMVSGDNLKSLRMCSHLGFRVAHRIKDGKAQGVDMVMFEMRRDECRYIGRA